MQVVYSYRLDHIRHVPCKTWTLTSGGIPQKKGPLALPASVIEPTDWRSVRSTARSR
jgi:hypothetical protein